MSVYRKLFCLAMGITEAARSMKSCSIAASTANGGEVCLELRRTLAAVAAIDTSSVLRC